MLDSRRKTFTSSGGRLLQSSKPIPGIYGYFINNKSGCAISSLNLVLTFYFFGFFHFKTMKVRLNFLTWWTPHEVQVFQKIEYGSIKMANILILMRGYSWYFYIHWNRNLQPEQQSRWNFCLLYIEIIMWDVRNYSNVTFKYNYLN